MLRMRRVWTIKASDAPVHGVVKRQVQRCVYLHSGLAHLRARNLLINYYSHQIMLRVLLDPYSGEHN